MMAKSHKPPRQLFRQPRPETPGARTRRDDLNDIRFIATHEAGHAVSAVVLGLDLKSVDIHRRHLPDGTVSLGFTNAPSARVDLIRGKGEEAVMPDLIQSLTGPSAEQTLNPRVLSTTACDNDMKAVQKLAAVALCESTIEGNRVVIKPGDVERNRERIGALVGKAAEAAEMLVSRYWNAILVTAAILVKYKSLTRADVAEIIAANPPRSEEEVRSEEAN
jgi:hypothetical protein